MTCRCSPRSRLRDFRWAVRNLRRSRSRHNNDSHHAHREYNHGMTAIEKHFQSLGISKLVPGFYDDPAFLAAERSNPLLLEDYALYVNELQFSNDYLDRARDL